MFGSLNEFLDIEEPPIFPLEQEESEVSEVPIVTKKTIIDKRKKSKSVVDGYAASNKIELIYKFAKNYPQHEILKKKQPEEQKNYLIGRKQISQHQASFFPVNKTIQTDEIMKERLKRQHNLLRAIVRTKQKQGEHITASDYEQSYARMSEGLSKIKVKPVPEVSFMEKREEKKTNRNYHLVREKPKKLFLSNKKRLQFENCLSWTKRRKKDGSFYADKLGKNQVASPKNEDLEKRKEIINKIHHRGASFSFGDQY